MKNTRVLIIAALLAALCCIATLVIRIPTPTMGYIHPGDAFVLLCGLLLGPLPGGLASGIGSALADIIGGYVSYAPATFVIKALSAVLASVVFSRIKQHLTDKKFLPACIPAGIIGELFMVIGYFVYEIFLLGVMTGSFGPAALSAGFVAALGGIAFNITQGVVGIILACILYPIIAPVYKKALR